MARKVVKHIKSKGERLGWTPLDQVKPVSLTSILVKGQRVTTNQTRLNNDLQEQVSTSYLIP